MLPQIIRAKIHKPLLRSKVVHRLDLIEVLEQGRREGRCLTLISAPAGSGKTTLLTQWVTQAACPTAWLSLGEEENDPVRFWTHLVEALRAARLTVGVDAFASMVQQPGDLSGLVLLLNQLAELPEGGILVLDDYHVISSGMVHQGVNLLLEHLPPQFHLVISTRADPALPLSRYRVRGQLTELRAADLRLSTEEAAEFFNQIMGLHLGIKDIETLQVRTEGWIAGLQLAALSLKGHTDPSTFVQAFSGSHHYTLEYLTEEVLGGQPESVQEFLLQSSILDEFCAELCDALTGEANARTMLEYLERINLFVIPLDDEHTWYRYHHLFADLLHNGLRKTHAVEQISNLHQRAAIWYEKNEIPDAATRHALAAGDFNRAADLLERHALAMLTRGENVTLLNRMHALPQEVVRSRPALCIAHAWPLIFAGQFEDAEILLQAAEKNIPAVPETLALELQGSVAVIRALMADTNGQLEKAAELAQRANRLLPANSLLARSLIPHILGRAYRSNGDMARAASAFEAIVRIGENTGNIWTLAVAKSELATLRKIEGRLRQAEALYDEVWQTAVQQGHTQFGTLAVVNTGRADLLRERNQLDEAQQQIQQALRRFQWWRSPTDQVLAYVTLSRIRIASGQVKEAQDALSKADAIRSTARVYPQVHAFIDACRVHVWLAAGHHAEAARLLLERAPREGEGLLIEEAFQILATRVWLAQGRADESLGLLSRLFNPVEAGGRHGRLIEILILMGMAYQAEERLNCALDSLTRALSLAEPEDYVRLFLDQGEAMLHLLQRGLERGSWPDSLGAYARRLIQRYSPPTVFRPMTGQLVDPLSSRELEVLRLLERGYSNQEIAQHLVVTHNTAKKHVSNVFSKLGVNSRTQALARARELGLLN